tara:strand:+ start:1166 stop:1657 length:492 start_codon:yes stop_codon:yes gene_type:complete
MTKLNGPHTIVLVTCREHMEIAGKTQLKEDVSTVGWHMPCSHKPKMYAIAIFKNHFTAEVIKKSESFAVNFIPHEMEKEALFCGKHTGYHMDKFVEGKIETEEAYSIDAPIIKNALAVIECELEHQYESGDHIIFVGRIVSEEIKKEGKRLLHIDEDVFSTTQ